MTHSLHLNDTLKGTGKVLWADHQLSLSSFNVSFYSTAQYSEQNMLVALSNMDIHTERRRGQFFWKEMHFQLAPAFDFPDPIWKVIPEFRGSVSERCFKIRLVFFSVVLSSKLEMQTLDCEVDHKEWAGWYGVINPTTYAVLSLFCHFKKEVGECW